ncbi:twin-arginine translocation pathway signal [Luminiphilus syltensis NOR5-1B]|uniref:Twin-arginine translocation pathway signal n=1 Tax=Luminiphilus syltensis NOR5-1B TaxID=565045 RepID=B8KTS9_9GAMM|nr:NAD(P)/FAD-dependent oxidoreductase [Luminiphilus syltensis]EED34654.1 twin-arginine translocation pathway signal [Luminiphilus syltensis NOR5-1B]
MKKRSRITQSRMQRGQTAGLTRRDFLNGTLLTAGACALTPLELMAAAPKTPYPPALTGLRGSQPGSFDVAHALAWRGESFSRPTSTSEGEYDLVVVGGGISGLAAAYFWRQEKGPDARVLILDNHDDFGGHARRNELSVDGKLHVGYGGSQSIANPSGYSSVSKNLLRDLGIFTERFYDYFDQDFFSSRGLKDGIWFSESVYGRNVTEEGLNVWSEPGKVLAAETVARYPISEQGKQDLLRLLSSEQNYLADIPPADRREWLGNHSYRDLLLDKARVHEDVYLMLRDTMRGEGGVGWEAMPASLAHRFSLPGTRHLGVEATPHGTEEEEEEPYIFHFPDGNASVARSLVRALIPGVLPGSTMEDLVLARADYSALDSSDNPCRLRLNSTAIEVRHNPDQRGVDVTYVRNGTSERVRGKHVVMACYNAMVPYLCPELPEIQREAIEYAEKVPLVYITAALRNWEAFANLGFKQIMVPQPELMHTIEMDFPVSMGGVEYPQDPSMPTLIHGSFIPCAPDSGLTNKEQFRVGRQTLYQMSYDDFEAGIFKQLDGALAPGGFDVERDVAAVTVNRWPHGYAYEYNELFDPAHYGPDLGPHLAGAAQLGRISIANSDSTAWAFVSGAIDAARRAVSEQTG